MIPKAKWKNVAVIGGVVSLICATCYSVIIYPLQHLDEYKAIQKETRKGINQELIQPGNMKVWTDPFDRRKN